MAKVTEIGCILIRSGPNAWESEGRVCGRCDLPLTPEGRNSVLAGLQREGPLRLTAVLCGPDEASVSTARLVAGATGCKPRTVAGLEEMSFGLWEGMRGADLQEKCPKTFRQWIEDPASVTAPDGESAAEAQDRAVDALRTALSRHKGDGQVAIVMRPVVLGLVKCWLSGESIGRLWTVAGESPAIERRVVPRNLLNAPREYARAER